MRVRVLLNDKDYLTSFIDMASKAEKDIFIDLGFDGLIRNGEMLITDFSIDSLSHQYPNLSLSSVCMLVEGKAGEDYSAGPFRLFKYQRFDDLISKLKVCYYTLTGDSGIKSSNCIKIGFCFSNDVYKSTLIDELAKLLVYRCGVNLLVLSLKFMSDYCQNASYRHVDESLLKRLIYSIDRGMEIPIDSFFYTDSFGVYRLESSRIINPISEMRDGIFEKLIRYVTQNFFDVIIFDVSRCFSNRNLNVLKHMNQIVVVTSSPDFSKDNSPFAEELGLSDITAINPEVEGSALEIRMNEIIDDILSK